MQRPQQQQKPQQQRQTRYSQRTRTPVVRLQVGRTYRRDDDPRDGEEERYSEGVGPDISSDEFWARIHAAENEPSTEPGSPRGTVPEPQSDTKKMSDSESDESDADSLSESEEESDTQERQEVAQKKRNKPKPDDALLAVPKVAPDKQNQQHPQHQDLFAWMKTFSTK